MTVEILTLLIRLGIVIITGLIIPALRAWLKAKTDNENRRTGNLKTAMTIRKRAGNSQRAPSAVRPTSWGSCLQTLRSMNSWRLRSRNSTS